MVTLDLVHLAGKQKQIHKSASNRMRNNHAYSNYTNLKMVSHTMLSVIWAILHGNHQPSITKAASQATRQLTIGNAFMDDSILLC